MKAICIMRTARDIRFLSTLQVIGSQVTGDRIPLVANEGDIRAIGLLKDAGIPWTSVAPELLSQTLRTHLWVRGAEEVIELEGSQVIETDEAELAVRIATWIRTDPEIELVVLGESEQDSGRRLLPALLAGALDWPIIRGVSHIECIEGGLVVRVETDNSALLHLPLPALLVAHEAAPLGPDPSDEFELIEKFERYPPKRVAAPTAPSSRSCIEKIERPPARQTLSPRSLTEDEVSRVVDLILSQ